MGKESARDRYAHPILGTCAAGTQSVYSHRSSGRYAVLVCACFMTFGSYFCFDMPSVLQESARSCCLAVSSEPFSFVTAAIHSPRTRQKQIEHTIIEPWAPDNASTVYNLFYTVYAWTNMVMSLFAGVLTDRLGTRKCWCVPF
jgi:hypothetical protein